MTSSLPPTASEGRYRTCRKANDWGRVKRSGCPAWKGAVSRVLPIAYLAPDIVEAILEGRQPPELTAKRLRGLPEIPLAWAEQRRLLGFAPG